MYCSSEPPVAMNVGYESSNDGKEKGHVEEEQQESDDQQEVRNRQEQITIMTEDVPAEEEIAPRRTDTQEFLRSFYSFHENTLPIGSNIRSSM